MESEPITGDMRVWTVIQRYPQTYDVFRKHGCPDMRKGIYALSARVMKVKWAARAHKIPVEALLRDLNAAVAPALKAAGGDKAV
jgi:hypothetical protein